MSSPDPRRGHHVIKNGVKKIYRDIKKRFVDNFSINYFRGNNYVNLVEQNIINEVNRGGLPVDCVLRTAPLPHATESEIENSTVYTPRGGQYTNHKNAEEFGQAKEVLLVKVTTLMRDICVSLRDRKKMPNDLDERMVELCHFITNQFNRDVFVDKQAKDWWEGEEGPAGARSRRLEDWTQQVEKMLVKIAGQGTIQLAIHWGQWAFRLSEGFEYEHLQYT